MLASGMTVAADMEPGAAVRLHDVYVAPASTVPVSDVIAVTRQFETIEPEYVRPLSVFEAGRNDSNPVWAPDGKMIAFERSRGDKREIVITHADGKLLQTIYFQLSGSEKVSKAISFFLPGLMEDPSYNSGVSWASDGKRLVFMSNGGEGNYDIYSQLLGGNTQRLTVHREKDGLADWSPESNQIVFVSGRSGKGDVYLLEPETKKITQLTWGDKPYLYPRWSPDGKKIAMIYGSTENHDIFVIEDIAKPVESMRALTSWVYDDLRPSWSPDGRKIAFYTNFNAAGEQKKWALAVISADGSDSAAGAKLENHILAYDVVPDIEQGPAWLADGSGIAYVRDDAAEFNPVHIVDIASRKTSLLKTDTKMNHDVACTTNGLIAFRAQMNQWDQIYIAKLPTEIKK